MVRTSTVNNILGLVNAGLQWKHDNDTRDRNYERANSIMDIIYKDDSVGDTQKELYSTLFKDDYSNVGDVTKAYLGYKDEVKDREIKRQQMLQKQKYYDMMSDNYSKKHKSDALKIFSDFTGEDGLLDKEDPDYNLNLMDMADYLGLPGLPVRGMGGAAEEEDDSWFHKLFRGSESGNSYAGY